MANRIKFEMALKDLSFKFEGDYEQGQRIQAGINRALGEIAGINMRATGGESLKLIDAQVVNNPPPRHRRRTKSENSAKQEETAMPSGDIGNQAAPERRANRESPTGLLRDMRKAGFFEQGRFAADILGHLVTKGHTNFRHSDLTAPLASLCKKDILKRSQPDGKRWLYQNGEKDE